MRVLVTGHRGYIGSVLTPMLVGLGHVVRGLDSDLYSGCDFSPLTAGFEERIKDLRDVSLADVQDIDVVMHLAALSNDPVCEIDAALTMDINHKATLSLAALARQAGVSRFVFASSCTNYGVAADEALTEDAPLRPLTVYGESKVMAERDLARLASDSFSPVILRNATAYGIAPRLRLDLVVNDFCAGAVAGHQVVMQSDGSAWRPLIHVSDIARACIAAAESPREAVHNAVFNVGLTSENFRVRDLAAMVAQTVPDCTVTQRAGAGADKRSYRVDCAKVAAQMPMFKPRFTVRRGIEELILAFDAHPNLAAEMTTDRYRRIARLRNGLVERRLDADLRAAGSGVEMLKK
jgi:nucleoside-diphosphate-sugar epimerase